MQRTADELVSLVVDALRYPDRRKSILEDFLRAQRRFPGPRPTEWWWIFHGLTVDASLYEPDPAKYELGLVGKERMQEALVQAVADLKAAGFEVEHPP